MKIAIASLLLGVAAGRRRLGGKKSERPTDIGIPERPEGITEGPGSTLYVGQILSGKVIAVDAKTGHTETLVDEPGDGSGGLATAFGLWYYHDTVLVAGGQATQVFMYSAKTGDYVASCAPLSLNPNFGAFLNDVTVLDNGMAYVTDSFYNQLLVVDAKKAIETGVCDTTEIALPPSYVPESPTDFGANGIAPYANGLLVAHFSDGSILYIGDLDEEEQSYQQVIADGGAVAPDGIAVDGDKLYIAEGFADRISVWQLNDDDGSISASLLGYVTSELFATPATVAVYDGYVYAPNGRFATMDVTEPFDGDNVVAVKLAPEFRASKKGKKGDNNKPPKKGKKGESKTSKDDGKKRW